MRAGHGRASIVFVLVSFLLGCDRLPGRPTEAERYVSPDRVLDADALFAASCSGCHGEPGRPGPARDLGDPLFLAVIGKRELRRVIAEGVPGTAMPAFAQSEGGWLTEPQVDALAAGILTRWAAPTARHGASLPPYSEAAARKAGLAPGDATRGAAVYASHCASCHGADAGAGRAGSILEGAYLALVSDQGLRSVVIAGRPELDMPAWQDHDVAPPIGFQQISDVTAWLVAQRRPVPAPRDSSAGVTADPK